MYLKADDPKMITTMITTTTKTTRLIPAIRCAKHTFLRKHYGHMDRWINGQMDRCADPLLEMQRYNSNNNNNNNR